MKIKFVPLLAILLGSQFLTQFALSQTATEPAAATADASGPAKEALKALREGRFAKAIELATPLAEKGNAEACYVLGYTFEAGQGVAASRTKALEHYRKAAAGGYKEAAYRLSFILLASENQDERAQAREALEKAAKDDPTTAAALLGEAYLRGLLTKEPDYDQTVKWWNTAADAGSENALLMLARLYEGQFGFADKKDPVKATECYRKAAGLGNALAMVSIGSRLLNGDEKTRNEKEGREWLKKAIEKKESSAYLVLGDFEENSKKDLKAALAAYERGRDAGQVDCMLRTAKAYFEGLGTTPDSARGMDVLESAAKLGSPHAHYQLAVKRSTEEKPDLKLIYGHLLVAATGNVPDAQFELAMFYINGKLIAQDATAGVAWLTRASQSNHTQAQVTLAGLYLDGNGVPRNLANAGELYLRATGLGHAGATYAVAQMIGKGVGTEPNPVRGWAFAMLAVERGEKDAKAFADQMEEKMDDKQKAAAKQELQDLKAGKPLKAPEKPADPNKPAEPNKPAAGKDK